MNNGELDGLPYIAHEQTNEPVWLDNSKRGGEEEDGVNSRSDEPEQKTSAPLQRCDPMQAGIRKYGKPRDVASNHPPIQLTIGRAVKVALALVSATESDKMSGNYVISSEPDDRS